MCAYEYYNLNKLLNDKAQVRINQDFSSAFKEAEKASNWLDSSTPPHSEKK